MATFPFGLDRDRVTDQFVAIANGLSSGDVIPQEVSYSEDQAHDSFVLRTVTLKFAMKRDEQEG